MYLDDGKSCSSGGKKRETTKKKKKDAQIEAVQSSYIFFTIMNISIDKDTVCFSFTTM